MFLGSWLSMKKRLVQGREPQVWQRQRPAGGTSRPQLEALEDRRLLTAGILDTTFGTTGIVAPSGFTYHWADANNTGYHSAAVQADGKIVIAGAANGAAAGLFTVSRFNADGTPDTAFNANALKQTVHFSPGSTDVATAAAVQADGKIVVAGTTLPSGGTADHFAVTRYNADGTLDTTFGPFGGGHV